VPRRICAAHGCEILVDGFVQHQREGARTRIYALDETDAEPRVRDPVYDPYRPYASYPSDRAYR
jgi:hypothetical protein